MSLENILSIQDLLGGGVLVTFLVWFATETARETLVLSLGNDMDSHNIPNPKNGMKYFSFAASSVTYLTVYDLLFRTNGAQQ